MRRKAFLKLGLGLILFFCFLSEAIFSNNYLTVSSYKINTDKTTASFRAVMLSDLHGKEFGKDNVRLLRAVNSLKPDVIFVVGDMLNCDDKDADTALELYRGLCNIADVYCCAGNHERGYRKPDSLYVDIEKTGARLLRNEMKNVELLSGSFTVGGLQYYPYFEGSSPNTAERVFLEKFIEQEKENFSILLVHEPEFFMWSLGKMKLDLVLSGHTHGGIIRLPFIGGLAAPNQGLLGKNGELLPKYTKGLYKTDTATLIVSAGLSNEKLVPRLNNPPDICVIDIN